MKSELLSWLAGAALLLSIATPAAHAQVAGTWNGGQTFGTITLTQQGNYVSGTFTYQNGKIVGTMSGDMFYGVWIQSTSGQRCAKPAADNSHYWGYLTVRFSGNTFSGGWSYCETPPVMNGNATGTRIGGGGSASSAASASAKPQTPIVPIASPREVDCGDYHLKVNAGWEVPVGSAKGNWITRYGSRLKNGPDSPVTPLQIVLYGQSRPYTSESERQEAVQEYRTALWRGNAPVEQTDTMKVAGVKAERFLQKGSTGWRFYLFPYNAVNVYGIYVFVPGSKAAIPQEAADVLATLKLPQVKPPKPVVEKAEKPPKDYLKNVGGGMNFFSEEDERQLGFDASNQMNQQLALVQDAAIQGYVASLGQRLVAASRRPDLQCTFFVVNTQEINAFALPGCFVYVNRGLVDLAQNEGQLAGVMGHEIGHVIGRHGAKQISKSLLIQGLVAAASEIARSKSDQLADLIATAGGFGAMLANLKYSRDDEHQADALGVETMAAAGYDPHDLINFFHRMEPSSGLDLGSRVEGIMSTHPLTADREKVLAEQVASIPYSGSAENSGVVAFQNCQNQLAGWPAPNAYMTLSNALAATGLAGDAGK